MHKILFNLGITLRRLGELDASIAELKKATETKSDKGSMAPTWNNLGLS